MWNFWKRLRKKKTRTIKEGETAVIRIAPVVAHGVGIPHFFVGEEEVAVPHDTIFRAFQEGEELYLTYVECFDPEETFKISMMVKGPFLPPIYFDVSGKTKLDNNQVTAVRVPK